MNTILFFISILITPFSPAKSNIKDRNYSYWANSNRQDVLKQCQLKEMNAYNLSGDAETLSSKISLCPNNESNCCGEEDVKNINLYYMSDRKRQ